MLGAARHLARAVHAAGKAPDPAAPPLPPQRVGHRFTGGTINVKPVESKRLDQVLDRRTAVAAQVHREDIAQFDTSQMAHRRTVARRYDIRPIRSEPGTTAHGSRRVTHVIDETSAAAPISPASPPSAAGTTRRSRMKLNPV